MNTLLRTLTVKSKIGFGRFKETTVQELLDNYCIELIQMYYNLEKINYSEDIIEKLGITKIEKPGKCPSLIPEEREKFWSRYNKNKTEKEIIKDKSSFFKFKRDSKTCRINTQTHISNNKAALQFKNQGHK